MRYLAAYLLVQMGGNDKPSAKDVTAVLESVGIDVDATLIKKVISELKGKDIEEVMAAGREKLASVPSGGGGGAPAAAAATEAPVEEKKEEKKEESEEESDEGGFGDLFG